MKSSTSGKSAGQSATPCCSTRIAGRGYKSLLRCAIEKPFRMVTRIEMLSATSILSSASGGIESDLSNESLLLCRHAALQLFKPVQHDVDLRRGGSLLLVWLEHQEALAVRRDIVGGSR